MEVTEDAARSFQSDRIVAKQIVAALDWLA
jgi:hypothetical protein